MEQALFDTLQGIRHNESAQSPTLICVECGKESEGNVTSGDDEICNSCDQEMVLDLNPEWGPDKTLLDPTECL